MVKGIGPAASNSSITSFPSSLRARLVSSASSGSLKRSPSHQESKRPLNKDYYYNQIKRDAIDSVNRCLRLLYNTKPFQIVHGSEFYCKHSLFNELLLTLSELNHQEEKIRRIMAKDHYKISLKEIINEITSNQENIQIVLKIINEVTQEESLIEKSAQVIDSKVDKLALNKSDTELIDWAVIRLRLGIDNLKDLIQSVERIRQFLPFYLPCSSTTCLSTIRLGNQSNQATWNLIITNEIKRISLKIDHLKLKKPKEPFGCVKLAEDRLSKYLLLGIIIFFLGLLFIRLIQLNERYCSGALWRMPKIINLRRD